MKKKNFKGVITTDIRNFYETQIKFNQKHFSDVPELPKISNHLHNFSDSETNELNTLINSLKTHLEILSQDLTTIIHVPK